MHEEKLTIRFITCTHAVKCLFSYDLKKLLKIEHDSYYTKCCRGIEYRDSSIDVPYTQPVIRKTPIVFPRDDAYAENFWIEIKAHARYTMPTDDYTLEELKKISINLCLITFTQYV